jgi:hypothetical protein
MSDSTMTSLVPVWALGVELSLRPHLHIPHMAGELGRDVRLVSRPHTERREAVVEP